MTYPEPKWPFPRADALPPYAFVTTDAAKAKVLAAGADLIDLGLGNPDQSTPREILDVFHASADIGQNHRYHPGRGLPELRSCAARSRLGTRAATAPNSIRTARSSSRWARRRA